MSEMGLVHIYTGDGKGKTTAAAGLCFRAVGSGKSAAVYAFMKSPNSGECVAYQKLGIKYICAGTPIKFTWDMNKEELLNFSAQIRLQLHNAKNDFGNYDLVVLDEIINAVSANLISEDELIDIINAKPFSTELILTGRGASERLIDAASYVSIIECKKHPFNSGVCARSGIEY